MEVQGERKTVFSGIQPSGHITLGNYLGALKHWVDLQDTHDCIYCVVNQHAITVRVDPKELKQNTLEAYALLVACGVDPEKSTLFIQSQVAAHAQLAWVLNCYTPFGELSRMTQFKEKSQVHQDNINAGLFTYPSLMAADILLYQTHLVPVGDDQKQHIELTRNVAQRFNGLYGDVFVVPEPHISQTGARIMSLADPTKKMSKSDENPRGTIGILDSKDSIIKKFRSAVTDSDMLVAHKEGKDGINNLMEIYSCVTGKTLDAIEAEFEGKGYGDFKSAVGETVADYLTPIREKHKELMEDPAELKVMYDKGAGRAEKLAQPTLDKVTKKIGFI